MTAVAKYGKPQPITKLPEGSNRMGSGFIVGEDVAAGDAIALVPNAAAIAAGIPTMQIMRAIQNGGALSIVAGFAPMDAKVAQQDALTVFRDLDWIYGQGFIAAFLTPASGTVYLYLSSTVYGGLDTAPSAVGQLAVGMILDDGRVRLWGSLGSLDLGDTPTKLTGVKSDEFVVSATAGNGAAFSWQNPETTPIIIPAGSLIVDVKTVASGACTLDVGTNVAAATDNTNLISAQDVHAAVGLFSNTTAIKVPIGYYVTGTLSAPTAFVGNVALDYKIVAS